VAPQGNLSGQMRDRLWGGDSRNYFNQGRNNPGSEANREEMNKSATRQRGDGVCYWCRQDGHHQTECTNPPFCFRCKESGHVAAKWPSAKSNTIHMYGFCDNPIRDNSVLSPKPLHLVIKR
jgi:hypothetical protein